MREEFYYETLKRSQMVSVDLVNKISTELIAATEDEAGLNRLLDNELKAQEARKKALMIAYKEFPNPTGFLSYEDRKELVEKRNKLVEELFQKYIKE